MDPAYITVSEIIEINRLMIEEYGITLVQMMENAGIRLSDLACRMLDENLDGKNITVLCGSGNNGGSGLVAARHLSNRGAYVTAILAVEERDLQETPLLL